MKLTCRLYYNISRTDRGFQIDISGYSENIPQLLHAISKNLKRSQLMRHSFQALKQNLRDTQNANKDTAYKQLYELRYLTKKHIIHRDDIYKSSETKLISSQI